MRGTRVNALREVDVFTHRFAHRKYGGEVFLFLEWTLKVLLLKYKDVITKL